MKKLESGLTQLVALVGHVTRRLLNNVCPRASLCVLVICVGACASFAQAPGWSRGQQLLAITYDECLRRAPQALQAEGYRIDYAGGNFAVGIKNVHTAVVICNPAPDAKLVVNTVVASNGEGGGTERQRLQTQMERPGAVRGRNNSFTSWTWAYAPPGQEPEVHGTVKLFGDGKAESSDGNSGTWGRAGNYITIKWKTGEDTLVLSDNETVMKGTNSSGWNIRGTLKRQ
jgi:hypothetical protein